MVALVVSFFTPGYADHAARLRESLARSNLEAWIEPVETEGAWEHTCARKAAFVRKALECALGPVLWLDADATVHGDLRPLLEDLRRREADFAVHRTGSTHPRLAFRSGTVWFNRTPRAIELADRWVDRCARSPRTWDQESLFRAHGDVDGVATEWLDEAYCCRFDDPGAEAAVVVHHQASRELKRSPDR